MIIGGGRCVSNLPISSGHLHLEAPDDTTCVDADTYYQIVGTFGDENDTNRDYTTAEDGTLVYVGRSGLRQFVTLSASFGVDKACILTLGVLINGTPSVSAFHTFLAQAKDAIVVLPDIVMLDKDDEITIEIKSSVADTDVTVELLIGNFVGEP